MKINAISATTFGKNKQIVKKAATGFMAATGSLLAADTFVKGISKPNKAIEEKSTDDILRGNDEGWNPCDSFCDDLCGTPQAQREDDTCDCDC